jgi:prepilin-type N-terminal cleavage/methylation domain-containing protein
MDLRRGFTLIEMAIVITILGLAAGMAVKVIKPLKDVSRTDLTRAHLKIIDKALQLYAIQNGCLPCPANGSLASTSVTTLTVAGVPHDYSTAGLADDGASAPPQYLSGCTTSATCRTTNLTVPWITLGISEEEASDGWGDRIRYIVKGTPCTGSNLAGTNGMIRCLTSGATAFPTGSIAVSDTDTGSTPACTPTEPCAAYALISSGPDRASALKAHSGGATGNTAAAGSNQLTNASDGTTVYKGSANNLSGASYFDDIVVFKTPRVLILTCGSNACGNPA